jgi:hypothetical protein
MRNIEFSPLEYSIIPVSELKTISKGTRLQIVYVEVLPEKSWTRPNNPEFEVSHHSLVEVVNSNPHSSDNGGKPGYIEVLNPKHGKHRFLASPRYLSLWPNTLMENGKLRYKNYWAARYV